MELIVKTDLQQFADVLAKLSPDQRRGFHLAIAEELIAQTRERFQTSTDPYGKTWVALKPSTLIGRERTLGGRRVRGSRGRDVAERRMLRNTPTSAKPLILSSELMNSINSSGTDAASIRVGTPKRYARYHQGEAGSNPAKIPRRMIFPDPELGLPKTYMDAIAEMFDDYIQR